MHLPPLFSTCDEMKNEDTLKMQLNLTALRRNDNPVVTFSQVRFYTVSIFTILRDEE